MTPHTNYPYSKIDLVWALIDNPRLTAVQKCMAIGIVRHADDDLANSFPGATRLAHYGAVTRTQTIWENVAALETTGMFFRYSRGNGRSNGYTIQAQVILSGARGRAQRARQRLDAVLQTQCGQRTGFNPKPSAVSAPGSAGHRPCQPSAVSVPGFAKPSAVSAPLLLDITAGTDSMRERETLTRSQGQRREGPYRGSVNGHPQPNGKANGHSATVQMKAALNPESALAAVQITFDDNAGVIIPNEDLKVAWRKLGFTDKHISDACCSVRASAPNDRDPLSVKLKILRLLPRKRDDDLRDRQRDQQFKPKKSSDDKAI